VLAQYLDIKGVLYTKIAHETWTKSWGQKHKNKDEGLKKGFPDYVICLPKKLLFIELKKVKGGVVSIEQKEWIEQLDKYDGVYAAVCRGAKEAIELIEIELIGNEM
jgi:hypothetical protein